MFNITCWFPKQKVTCFYIHIYMYTHMYMDYNWFNDNICYILWIQCYPLMEHTINISH